MIDERSKRMGAARFGNRTPGTVPGLPHPNLTGATRRRIWNLKTAAPTSPTDPMSRTRSLALSLRTLTRGIGSPNAPHEREARTKGVSVLGSGRIFPVKEETLAI